MPHLPLNWCHSHMPKDRLSHPPSPLSYHPKSSACAPTRHREYIQRTFRTNGTSLNLFETERETSTFRGVATCDLSVDVKHLVSLRRRFTGRFDQQIYLLLNFKVKITDA